uniref:Uncharacterized protein n=1 Tax=Anopheles culicifacies TaxID=139723 RepID=A0A182MH95_9DIPT
MVSFCVCVTAEEVSGNGLYLMQRAALYLDTGLILNTVTYRPFYIDLSWCDGWPLAVAGALVLHLGALDESLVRSQDTYLCIRPEPDTSKPELYAVWRGTSTSSAAGAAATATPSTVATSATPHPSIVYRRLDPIRDPVTPLAVEMLTEDLPALLQNLLVAIERAISRVPLEDLSFPTPDVSATLPAIDPPLHAPDPDENGELCDPSRHVQHGSAPGTPKLGLLKRRELITKNNKLLINSKYTQLKRQPLATVVSGANLSTAGRLASPGATGGNQNGQHAAVGGKSENAPQIGSNQCNDGLSVTICDTGGDEGGGGGGGGGGQEGDNQQSTAVEAGSLAAAAAAGMPLFCLGGSFPHIDSDEESSDEQKKCETGKSRGCVA